MAWVYILKCKDGTYYVGFTTDLERRIAEHQAGTYCGYTYYRRPVELVFCQETETMDDAFHLEQQVKGWSRKKKEALISGNYDLLHELAKRHRKTQSMP